MVPSGPDDYLQLLNEVERDSNQITRDYFDSILIETRYINSTLPTVNTKFLGYEFDTPIMTAALSHLHNVCENGMTEHANAAAKSNAACFVGMDIDHAISGNGTYDNVYGLPMKPKSFDEIKEFISFNVNHGPHRSNLHIGYRQYGNPPP